MSNLSEFFFSGLAVGCIYAFVALGLVVVSNVSGVFNFATGEYVMIGGMIMAATASAKWPLALCTVAAMAVVAGVAMLQERLTVAPVRGKLGPLGMVIASLGVSVTLRGVALLIWKQNPRVAPPYQTGNFTFLGARLADQVIWIYAATAVALAGVIFLFTRTDVGRAMRASAINPIAARLTGIRIGTMSLAAFALSGALCGLIAAVSVSQTEVSWDSGITIGLIGFIAAALAGFDSPGKAVLAGLALGVVESMAAGYISSPYRDAIVYGTLVVYLLGRDFYGHEGLISRALKSHRASAAGSVAAPELRAHVQRRVHAVEGYVRARTADSSNSQPSGGAADRLRERLRPRSFRVLAVLPLALLVLAWFYPSTTSDQGSLDQSVFIVVAAMAATGLGLVMGLSSQFSLGQAGFMLIGGYTAGILTANHHWAPLAALGAGVALSIVIGLLVGLLTLRLEGLNLALATLALLVIATVFVSNNTNLTGGDAGLQNVAALKIFGTTFQSSSSYLHLCLIVLGAMLLIARNIWRSRMGRALRAIGIDQEAAESVGLDAWRLKLRIFVLSSAMAGLAGVLSVFYLQFASPQSWDVSLTIDLVTYVIVGGVSSPYGGAVGAVVVGALQYYFRQHIGSSTGGNSSTYEVLLSGALIIFFVLVFKTGLAAIPRMIADRVNRMRQGARPAETLAPTPLAAVAAETTVADATATLTVDADGDGSIEPAGPFRDEAPLVVVDGLTKRFGSLAAVDGLSFSLRPGHVTALIGPNGAGKSTVINMLAGTLLPSSGAVGIMGRPVVGLQSHEIAQLGLARTFQTPRLFEGMTLLQTVMLARDRYGSRFWLAGGALRTPRARRDEQESREQAMAWLSFVGLAADADALAISLPVGKQRMAEFARALATEPAVLLLDEPAAGLDGAETRALGQLIRSLGQAGIAVLLVEHDMGMVMSVADHIVVLEEGKKIAEGPPEKVSHDQVVIDAYLGVVHA